MALTLGLGLGLQGGSIGVSVEVAATIDTFSVGAFADGALPVILDVTNGSGTEYWVIYPSTETKPSDTQIKAGNQQNGTAATASGSFAFVENFDAAVPTGIARGNYKMAVVIENGAGFSNTEESAAFLLDTTANVLSLPTVSTTSGAIDAGVTSDTAFGTIFAAYRLSTDAVLTETEIKNGTGNAIGTATDTTPTADANNSVSFTGVSAGTYVVDFIQDNDFGVPGNIVSSASIAVTVSSATDTFTAADQVLTSYTGESGAGWTERNSGSGVMRIVSNDATCTDSIGTAITTRDDTAGNADGRVTINMRMDNLEVGSPNMSPIMRAADASNFYIIQYAVGSGKWLLRKTVAGSTTTLAEYTATFAETTVVEVQLECIGTAIKGYIDGVERMSATDSEFASGLAGMRAYGGDGGGSPVTVGYVAEDFQFEDLD